jgi:transposase
LAAHLAGLARSPLRAKKTKAFVETLGGKLRLFSLPPYAPDRNPDELVWKHLKADTVGRSAIQGYADFKAKVKSSMHSGHAQR